MKPQDWFGLGVRGAGIWCLMQAVLNVAYFLDMRLGFADSRGASFTMRDSSPVGFLLYAAVYAGLAAYFILGAGHISTLSYGQADASERQSAASRLNTSD